jgi:ATP-dependent protease HslVU (ClpYQ) peptidase subunit
MTIICWDGKTLAADKRSVNNGMQSTVRKIFKLQDGRLFGACGEASFCMAMLKWVKDGEKESEFPSDQRGDNWQLCCIVDSLGIGYYEKTPILLRREDLFTAFGSGRDYAIAAMHLGKTAKEAVEIANLFDVHCGNGVDELTLT